MNNTVNFKINGWSYSIQTDSEFSVYLEDALLEDFKEATNNAKRTILLAYIRAKYQLFEQEKEIEKIIEVINENT